MDERTTATLAPGPPPADLRLQRSSRDTATVTARLTDWLDSVLPPGADPTVVVHGAVDANGMSSETVPLDVTWTDDRDDTRVGRYVARVAPDAKDVPVFPAYDLQHQYDAIRLVGELTDVPVPAVHGIEPTGDVLGAPFFLMDRVEGVVPPDVLPYTFGDNWLFDADAVDKARLQRRTVETIAALHAVPDVGHTFGFLAPDQPGTTALARNLARTRAWYDFAVPDIGRSPMVERALAWLEVHLPTTVEAVLCWGDARIGNVLYRDFEPVGVLDWEMATLGPRELDVSWLVFAHQVFQSITDMLELPGMPEFLAERDVRAAYEEVTGVVLGDLTWYHVYNGVQWSIVFMRTGARQVRFGEIERPEDLETLMHNKPLLEQLLAEVGA